MPEGTHMSTIRLTRRGQRLVTWTALTGFLLLLGIAGWIEGM